MWIAFIGGGIMGEAIVKGVLGGGIAKPKDIRVGDTIEARRLALNQGYAVQVFEDNKEAVRGAAFVILAVKPQNLPEVMAGLKGSISAEQVVISIVAGATLETVITGLGHDPVIRVMPNMPSQVGSGMCMWTASCKVDDEKKDVVRQILQTLGEEIYVSEEKYLDMATALSASGPAYVFKFIESLIEAGVYIGIPRDMARTLVVQTIEGSIRLMKESGIHPAVLKDMVTSPGGTTAEALLHLDQEGFGGIVIGAVVAAYEKSLLMRQQ